jgi:hypothetical protein
VHIDLSRWQLRSTKLTTQHIKTHPHPRPSQDLASVTTEDGVTAWSTPEQRCDDGHSGTPQCSQQPRRTLREHSTWTLSASVGTGMPETCLYPIIVIVSCEEEKAVGERRCRKSPNAAPFFQRMRTAPGDRGTAAHVLETVKRRIVSSTPAARVRQATRVCSTTCMSTRPSFL